MKKLTILIALFLSCNCALAYQFSSIFDDNIKIGNQISYDKNTHNWSRTQTPNSYTFTKYITTGTGGFSEYEYNKKKNWSNTTFEFLYNNRLIGYNHHTLKFYDLSFDGKNFIEKELTTSDLKEFFPDVEFVKISDFKNNEITLYKPLFAKKNYLLVNDTNRDFYKYFFEHYSNEKTLFRALFSTIRPRTFVYSHFGSRDELTPPLFIHIKTKGLF